MPVVLRLIEMAWFCGPIRDHCPIGFAVPLRCSHRRSSISDSIHAHVLCRTKSNRPKYLVIWARDISQSRHSPHARICVLRSRKRLTCPGDRVGCSFWPWIRTYQNRRDRPSSSHSPFRLGDESLVLNEKDERGADEKTRKNRRSYRKNIARGV